MRYLIDIRTGCWIWPGGSPETYPVSRIDGQSERLHRHFAAQHGNLETAGRDVHHTCRNRRCVNPDHLASLDHAEHSRLSASAGPRPLDETKWTKASNCTQRPS